MRYGLYFRSQWLSGWHRGIEVWTSDPNNALTWPSPSSKGLVTARASFPVAVAEVVREED